MAGALEAILELAVAYANERVAFERPIAKFQAVQHNLARLAGEVAVAIAAAGSAADAIANAADVRRGRVPRGRLRQDPRRRGRQRRAPASPTRCWAPSALRRSTRCIASRAGCGPGATISATRAPGRSKLGTLVAAKGADGLWPMLAAR